MRGAKIETRFIDARGDAPAFFFPRLIQSAAPGPRELSIETRTGRSRRGDARSRGVCRNFSLDRRSTTGPSISPRYPPGKPRLAHDQGVVGREKALHIEHRSVVQVFGIFNYTRCLAWYWSLLIYVIMTGKRCIERRMVPRCAFFEREGGRNLRRFKWNHFGCFEMHRSMLFIGIYRPDIFQLFLTILNDHTRDKEILKWIFMCLRCPIKIFYRRKNVFFFFCKECWAASINALKDAWFGFTK